MSSAPKRHWLQFGLRSVRKFSSLVCLTACMGIAALWVRSYFWTDQLCRSHGGTYLGLISWEGTITLGDRPNPPPAIEYLQLVCTPADEWQDAMAGRTNEHPELLGFGYERFKLGGGGAAFAPHWFFVAVAGGLAAALKPRPRRRFGMRDLLVVMTLVATLVCAVMLLPRSF